MGFWAGKSVIVTGAGSGIGKELSTQLSACGAKIWMSDINADRVRAAAEAIGAGAIASKLDVTDATAVKTHIDNVIAEHGHLDALFNNAGIGTGAIAEDLDISHFDKSLDVNVRGVTNGILAAYKHMSDRESGIIVNTASAAGLLALPLMAPYSMSKFAVVGLTRALRIEAAERGVQISALCPTAIETPLIDAGNPAYVKQVWTPNIREYLTDVGGPPYPVDKFVTYALAAIERNKGIIVAPVGARFRLGFARFFPGIVEGITRKAYRKQLSQRN